MSAKKTRNQNKVQPELHAKQNLDLDCLEVKASTRTQQRTSNLATGHFDMTLSNSCCCYRLVLLFSCPQLRQLNLQLMLGDRSWVQLLLNKPRCLNRHHMLWLQTMIQSSITKRVCSHCSCMCQYCFAKQARNRQVVTAVTPVEIGSSSGCAQAKGNGRG